jgi:hypothetical protein
MVGRRCTPATSGQVRGQRSTVPARRAVVRARAHSTLGEFTAALPQRRRSRASVRYVGREPGIRRSGPGSGPRPRQTRWLSVDIGPSPRTKAAFHLGDGPRSAEQAGFLLGDGPSPPGYKPFSGWRPMYRRTKPSPIQESNETCARRSRTRHHDRRSEARGPNDQGAATSAPGPSGCAYVGSGRNRPRPDSYRGPGLGGHRYSQAKPLTKRRTPLPRRGHGAAAGAPCHWLASAGYQAPVA